MTPVTPPYQPFPNRFRADLRAGKLLIGCWCSLANPITTEVLGVAGFDWLLLDGEHSPNDLLTFVPQLMALKDSASAPVVRPAWNNPVEIKRLLDGGFYNFLIPFVENADEARRAVAATRYPPQGIRGVSVAQRSNRYGTVAGYFDGINEQICVLVQIESRKGVAAAAEIAAVDGIDGLFIGPSDLAAGFGHLGNPGHAEVQQAMTAGVRGRQGGRQADRHTRAGGGRCAPLHREGASFVAVGSDLGVFRSATQALRDRYRSPA